MKRQIIKTSLGFLIILMGITSCAEKQATQDEIVRKNAEEYLQPKLNDPSSYEFVKIELLDSVLYSDNVNYRREKFQKEFEKDKENLERQERQKTETSSIYSEEEVAELNEKMKKNEKILYEINSLETKLGDRKSSVASYTYVFNFRGNNALGAKVLNE